MFIKNKMKNLNFDQEIVCLNIFANINIISFCHNNENADNEKALLEIKNLVKPIIFNDYYTFDLFCKNHNGLHKMDLKLIRKQFSYCDKKFIICYYDKEQLNLNDTLFEFNHSDNYTECSSQSQDYEASIFVQNGVESICKEKLSLKDLRNIKQKIIRKIQRLKDKISQNEQETVSLNVINGNEKIHIDEKINEYKRLVKAVKNREYRNQKKNKITSQIYQSEYRKNPKIKKIYKQY